MLITEYFQRIESQISDCIHIVEPKAFIGHLLGRWFDPFEHMLDYTSGEAVVSQDQPGIFDRNDLDGPQDVVEYWAKSWSENDKFHHPSHESGTGLGLNPGWYRDILRAKLVSLRIPKRLLLAYREQVLEKSGRLKRGI